MFGLNRRTCGWLCVAAGVVIASAIGLWLNTASGDEPSASAVAGKASEETIHSLEAYANDLERIHAKIDILNQTGSRGGEQDQFELIAAKWNAARAELATAKGESKDAVNYAELAWGHSELLVPATQAGYQAGTLRLSDLLAAQELRKNCALALEKLKQTTNAK